MKLLLLSEYERRIIGDALELFIQKVEDPNTTVLDEKTEQWVPAKTIIQEDADVLLKRVEKKEKNEDNDSREIKTMIALIMFKGLFFIAIIALIALNIFVIKESHNAFHKAAECERLGGAGVVDRGYKVICLKDSALLQEGA